MGLLEAAVVIYLRALYYPEGFQFPVAAMPMSLANVELWREVATIVMLVSIAYLSANNASTRFASFLVAFAIWDIAYYFFLYVFIGWPAHVMDWDILFLLPWVWTGPVLSPIILSLLMILLGFVIIHNNKKVERKLSRKHWFLLISASLISIYVFLEDFMFYAIQKFGSIGNLTTTAKDWLVDYSPKHFNWSLFSFAISLIILAIVDYARSQYFGINRRKKAQLF
jgi:hypothetical protein